MFPVWQIGGIHIYVFMLIVCLGFYVCYFYLLFGKPYHWIYRRENIYTSVFALLSGAVGGKVLSTFTLYLQDTTQSIFYHFLHSGSVFYGILLTGFVAAYIAGRKFKIDFCRYASEVAEVLPLGQAIGRIGCFMNGCCYGREYNGLFGIMYPVGDTRVRVFPSWFAESTVCLLLFLVFQKERFKRSRHTFLVYFIAYGSFRFLLEFMRGDEIRGVYGLLSTSQIISILLVLCSMGYLVFLTAKEEK